MTHNCRFLTTALTQSELTKSIQSTESEIDNSSAVERTLSDLRAQISDKKARIDKIKSEIRTSAFEERDAEATGKVKRLEDSREALNAELRKLSLQADERAKLDVKRGEVRGREGEMKSM